MTSVEPEQVTMEELLQLKQELHVPGPIWELIKDYAGKGRETEQHATIFFENVSRNMVLRGRRCPRGDDDPNFQTERAKVLRAFATRRDAYREYNRRWAPYLNSPLRLWQKDYLRVWDDYSHGRLR